MSKKKKKKPYLAVVQAIQPEDDVYCGDCEWHDSGECQLFCAELEGEPEESTCECCGAHVSTYRSFRLDDCIESTCLVEDE